MLSDPKILILDEPTAGLDPSERIRFRNLISRFAQGRTILLATHIVSDVECIAREILLLNCTIPTRWRIPPERAPIFLSCASVRFTVASSPKIRSKA